ncbi:MAG: 30S ribosome-binding factor RbfA [Clostridia bacterium]|nr:30S ribosome-binding factor RbfA [Clostridia bacterium]MBQ5819988.1 30S ribosome-binding factor RbfA [Clostridia bacterium]
MGSNYKQNRVNEEIKRAVASILSEVKDPRIPPMPTVVAVDVSGDLKYAKIYLSFLGEYNETEVRRGLKAATGYVRRRIGETVRMRSVPEPIFILDRSLEQGIRINEILKNLENGSN